MNHRLFYSTVMLAAAGHIACGTNASAPSTGTAGATTTSATSGGGTSVASGTTAATGGASVGAGGVATGQGGSVGAGGSTGGTGGGFVADGGAGASGDAGLSSDGGDTPPPHPLDVRATKDRHSHTFRASAADNTVSFNDNDQTAILDPRAAKLMGKLVLPFGGLGSTAGVVTPSGEFCARRGFHVLAVAAFENYDILLDDPDFYGDARKQVFDGITHTTKGAFANISMKPADGVAQRVQKGLQYLRAMFPLEDWGYYLNDDGTVRWSDVIFTGVSHGASNAPRFAMLVRASRVVSLSGPRDNMCTDAVTCGAGVVATWFSEVPKTPVDRFFALTGTQDDQHTQHLYAMQKLGYTGTPDNVDGAQPPYGGSHRLVTNGPHSDFCNETNYKPVCNYMFAVPPQNQNGVP